MTGDEIFLLVEAIQEDQRYLYSLVSGTVQDYGTPSTPGWYNLEDELLNYYKEEFPLQKEWDHHRLALDPLDTGSSGIFTFNFSPRPPVIA